LTDSTAQFTRARFPGHERVYIISFGIKPGATRQRNSRVPQEPPGGRLIPPARQVFLDYFTRLSREFDHILIITLSSFLSPMLHWAEEAACQYTNHATIQVVDSQTTAIGLGLLVQIAAGAAVAGASPVEIEQLVRATIPRVYMLFCIPEMNYLAEAGFLSCSQAFIGKMLGLLPIFTLEEGRLTPMAKVRTQRHLLESLQEFIDEFSDPYHVALIQGTGLTHLRARPLREYVEGSFPQTSFSVHAIGAHLATLFGPQCIGLVVMEKPEARSK
ncbi:MAG: DegV family protein, partial [Anaerolineales bacterium]|nr:DegV family protein [Anaerolineales bacterium]